MIVTEREREAETQAEGEAGSMHQEPDVGFDPGSPGSRPGPKAGAKPLRHPGIPRYSFLSNLQFSQSGCNSTFRVHFYYPFLSQWFSGDIWYQGKSDNVWRQFWLSRLGGITCI